MTLQEAHNFIQNLKTETTNKSESKVYEKFLYILSALKNRTFSNDEIHSIETELDRLNLESNPAKRKKHLKVALTKFEKYLKDKLSLTPEGYYTNLSISLGILFGTVIGVLIGERFEKSLGLSLGISIGMLIGVVIGRHMDSQAKVAGNVL